MGKPIGQLQGGWAFMMKLGLVLLPVFITGLGTGVVKGYGWASSEHEKLANADGELRGDLTKLSEKLEEKTADRFAATQAKFVFDSLSAMSLEIERAKAEPSKRTLDAIAAFTESLKELKADMREIKSNQTNMAAAIARLEGRNKDGAQ